MDAARVAAQENRGTLFIEDATIISIDRFPGEQFIIRLAAPKCARGATAGSFVHMRCGESIPMRRPLSIMRADPVAGWIEILFKIVGEGLRALGNATQGEKLSIIGPIGKGFIPSRSRPNTLLIGGGVGIPPMVFLAEQLKNDDFGWQPLCIMGSEIPFPFDRADSAIATDWLGDDILSTMPLLESWKIPTRLASLAGFAGCYRGYVTDLAREWLNSLSSDELAKTEIFSCGPTIMLKAVAQLAEKFELPCQVSLEEFMACGVGGCAGCTVLVDTAAGPAMKRVCVDGPVFAANSIFCDHRKSECA